MPFHGVPPPPYFHHSPFHVFAAHSISGWFPKPSAGLPGMAHQCHSLLPVSASQPDRYPRCRYSAPAWPMNTMPLPMRGAPVMDSALLVSTVCDSHTLLPSLMFTATRRPSSVAQMILPFQYAAPRFATLQHRTPPASSRGTFGSYFHSCLPDFASKAYTLLHGVVTMSLPSTSSGVPW